MRKVWFALVAVVLVLTLSSCDPAARAIADTIEHDGGASLLYSPGEMVFTPGPEPAVGFVLTIDGDNLVLLTPVDGCNLKDDVITCIIEEISNPLTIDMTGTDVIALAFYSRAGSNRKYTVFSHQKGQP